MLVRLLEGCYGRRVNYSVFGVVYGLIWLALLIWLGVRTLRRGHWVMFIVGLFIPLFWLIGALIPPKN
jgi:hypothetical protein